MLGQAVEALETQSQGGIKEIIQSIEPAFADLLADGDAVAAPAGQAEWQSGDQREPMSKEAESQPALSVGAKWDLEMESPPLLQWHIKRRQR